MEAKDFDLMVLIRFGFTSRIKKVRTAFASKKTKGIRMA